MTSRQIKSAFLRQHIHCTVSSLNRGEVKMLSISFGHRLPLDLEEILSTIINDSAEQGDESIREIINPDSNRNHFIFVLPLDIWERVLNQLSPTPSWSFVPQPQQLDPSRFLHVSEGYNFDEDVFEPVPEVERHCAKCNKKKRKNEHYLQVYGDYYCKKDFAILFDKCGICHSIVDKKAILSCDVCITDICKICNQRHPCNTLSEREKESRRLIYKIAKERKIPEFYLANPLRDVAYKFIAGKPEIPTNHIKINRFVGTEIEVERGQKFGLNVLLNPDVGIAHDGSLDRNTGIELQTPPSSLNELESVVTNTCQILKQRGYKSTIKCGLHVHLDARDFKNNHKKILQVIKTFYSIEDLIFSILPPSRWTSRFCQRLSKEYMYDNFGTGKKADVEWYKEAEAIILNVRKDKKYDKSRYYGLNIHSIFHRGTLELRYHSGTINEYKILMWTNFCLLVLEYALKNYNPKTIQSLFDAETSENKFNIMCGIFAIPSEMKQYLLLRVRKFNPNFNIKFNQGKEKRQIEKETVGKLTLEMVKMIEKIKPKAIKKIKTMFARNGIENADLVRTRDFIEAVQNTIDTEMKKLYPNEYGIMPMETGFIKDEEINQVISYIEQGRSLQRDIASDEDGELEEGDNTLDT